MSCLLSILWVEFFFYLICSSCPTLVQNHIFRSYPRFFWFKCFFLELEYCLIFSLNDRPVTFEILVKLDALDLDWVKTWARLFTATFSNSLFFDFLLSIVLVCPSIIITLMPLEPLHTMFGHDITLPILALEAWGFQYLHNEDVGSHEGLLQVCLLVAFEDTPVLPTFLNHVTIEAFVADHLSADVAGIGILWDFHADYADKVFIHEVTVLFKGCGP